MDEVNRCLFIFPTDPTRTDIRRMGLTGLRIYRSPFYAMDPHPYPEPAEPADTLDDVVLPDSSFLTFRGDCDKHLTPQITKGIDRIYQDGFKTALDFLDKTSPMDPLWGHVPCTRATVILKPRDPDPAPDGDPFAVPELLQQIASTSNSSADLHIRLKATQAAFLTRGSLLSFNTDAITATHNLMRSFMYLGAVTNRLDALCDPVAACFGALSIIMSGQRITLHHVRLDDVDTDVGSIDVGHGTYVLRERVFRFVHALTKLRQLQGANPADKLAPDSHKSGPGPAIGRVIIRASKIAKVGNGDVEITKGLDGPVGFFLSNAMLFVSSIAFTVLQIAGVASIAYEVWRRPDPEPQPDVGF